MNATHGDIEAIRRLHAAATEEFEEASEQAALASARLSAARQKVRALEATMRVYGLLDEEGEPVETESETPPEPDAREEAEADEAAEPRDAAARVHMNGSIDWTNLSRAAAIREVLRESGPMGPSDIARALVRHGREGDSPKWVSASLQRQADYKHVEPLGNGKWRVLKPREAEKD